MKRAIHVLGVLLALLALCSCAPAAVEADAVEAEPLPTPTLPYKVTTFAEIDLQRMSFEDKLALWEYLSYELEPAYAPVYEDDEQPAGAGPGGMGISYAYPAGAATLPAPTPAMRAHTFGEIDLPRMPYEEKMYLWMALSVELQAYSVGFYEEPPEEEPEPTPEPLEDEPEPTPFLPPTPGRLERQLRAFEGQLAGETAEPSSAPEAPRETPTPEPEPTPAEPAEPGASPSPSGTPPKQSAPVPVGQWGTVSFETWYGKGTCTLRIGQVLRGEAAASMARIANPNNTWESDRVLVLYWVDIQLDAWESDRPLDMNYHSFAHFGDDQQQIMGTPALTNLDTLRAALYEGGTASGWVALTIAERDMRPVARFRHSLSFALY